VRIFGRVAELVDALDSKSCGSNVVWVQVPPRPPRKRQSLVTVFFAFLGRATGSPILVTTEAADGVIDIIVDATPGMGKFAPRVTSKRTVTEDERNVAPGYAEVFAGM
jgi:hypothetical protein